MVEPTDWLRVQLDEDEAFVKSLPRFVHADWEEASGSATPPIAFDREVALDELAVKRKILDRYEEVDQIAMRNLDDLMLEVAAELARVVGVLAQPYRDRTGFPRDWLISDWRS